MNLKMQLKAKDDQAEKQKEILEQALAQKIESIYVKHNDEIKEKDGEFSKL